MTEDWARFRDEIVWFVEPGQSAEAGPPGPWTRGAVPGLPGLSALLAAATVTPVAVGDTAYDLLAWGPASARRGWLCLPPVESGLSLHDLHHAVLGVCGGVVERFGEPHSWWLNQSQVLTEAAARVSLEALPAAVSGGDHYPVAVEANGNLTLVHRHEGVLVLWAPDHAFEGVTPLADAPPYSLMTIDGVPDLASWLEVTSRAWAD